MDWASGLLGGVAGASDAVADIAVSRQKELADKLKQDAEREFLAAMEKKRQDFQVGRDTANNEHSLIVEGKRGENNMAVQKQQGMNSLETEKERGKWDIEQEKMRGQNSLSVANIQAGASKYSADKRDGDSDKGMYVKYFQQQDENGNVTMYGVRRDTGAVEPLNTGSEKGASKARDAAIEKIGELVDSKTDEGYNTARALAKRHGIALKEIPEVVEKNWFSKDKTRNRPSVDIDRLGPDQPQGVLGTGVTGQPSEQPKDAQKTTAQPAQKPDDLAKQLQDKVMAAKQSKEAPTHQPGQSASKPELTLDQITGMGKTAQTGSAPPPSKSPAPGEDGNLWSAASKGFGLLKSASQNASAVRDALEKRGVTDPTRKMLVETDLRAKYPNATDEELIQLILSAK